MKLFHALVPYMLLPACSPSGYVTVDQKPRPQGVPAGEDTGNGGITGDSGEPAVPGEGPPDTGTETGDDTGESPPQAEIRKSWTGSRIVEFPDYCEDELLEEGVQLLDGERPELSTLCQTCDELYELSVSPGAICYDSVPVATTTYRGLERLDADSFMVYSFSANEEGSIESVNELGVAERSGDLWYYSYEGSLQSFIYYVDGEIQLSQ